MRTYGRILKDPNNPNSGLKWVEVTTTPDGHNDFVWLTTLIQCLKLNLNESPFYASYGIPAKESIIQQIAPDFYVARTQRQFSSFFASLIISKEPTPRVPTYRINIVTNQGVKLVTTASIPK